MKTLADYIEPVLAELRNAATPGRGSPATNGEGRMAEAKKRALGADELEAMTCNTPGCSCAARYLRQRCHPEAGLVARHGGGVLALTCKRCGAEVANLALARESMVMDGEVAHG